MDDAYYVKGAPKDLSLDHLVKAINLNGHARAVCLSATNLTNEISRIHSLGSIETELMGRFAIASLLLASTMKNDDDSQTIVISSSGKAKGMTSVCDSKGNLKAYLQDSTETISDALGEGFLRVIRDIGLKEPYNGTVELVNGSIVDSFVYYLAYSEQTPSVLFIDIKMNDGIAVCAGGMMIQMMPGATTEDIEYIEKRMKGGFPDISFLMEEGFTPAKIIDLFMGTPDLQYLGGYEVGFKCSCSKEKMSAGIMALSKRDIEEISEGNEGVTTECHFCNSRYHFTKDEIVSLMH